MAPSSLFPCEDTEKMAVQEPGKRVLTRHSVHLYLGLASLQNCQNKFLRFESPPVCDILLQEPEWTSIQREASLLMPRGALSAHAPHPYFCSPAGSNVTWHWDSVDEFFSYFPLTGSLITVNFAIPSPGAFVFFILLHSFSRSESKQRTPFTFSCKRLQT